MPLPVVLPASLLIAAAMLLAVLALQDDELAFEPLRQPVLGYSIERQIGGELHRLVRVDGGRSVLVTGTLDACEAGLAETLRERFGKGYPNLEMPTLGGMQFWGDVFWYAGWRIQENVYTGHCRLLSPSDERHAWGSAQACRAAFEKLRHEREIELEHPHLVVLVHGLGRTRQTFAPMRDALRAAGYSVAAVEYPSTRRSIDEHADGLSALLDGLDDVETVSFVTHSLGGVVVRKALARESAWRERMELGRVIMLAPPSRGSQVARALVDFVPFRKIAGPSGVELGGELENLPPPPCPFGIIAAARDGERGWNPLLEGADDGVLAVNETELEGASDFLVVHGLHSFLMQAPPVVEGTLAFLELGRFRREEDPVR